MQLIFNYTIGQYALLIYHSNIPLVNIPQFSSPTCKLSSPVTVVGTAPLSTTTVTLKKWNASWVFIFLTNIYLTQNWDNQIKHLETQQFRVPKPNLGNFQIF